MSTAPAQTWHYGLISRWWAEFNLDGPEIDWFRQFVEVGQPALDAACGTGRLLIPYLHAALDVDGSDISADMLERVRERAEREGLAPPTLYAQAMHELDLARRYRTIIVCGGFGLGGRRADDLEGLRRLHEHLEPGGTLVLDNEVPYADGRPWKLWQKAERGELPRAWPAEGDRKKTADGDEIELRGRIVDFDPIEQSISREIRAFLRRDGELVAEEQHALTENCYFTHELELLLERAGFTDIEVRGALTERPPTADDDFVVFIAKKQ